MIQPTGSLDLIAGRINTGTDNSDNSRALIVFNQTEQPLSGMAVFRASMSWPHDVTLPPVTVTDFDGSPVPSAIQEMQEGSDAKGRADRRHLSFAIYFAVADVPAQGWRTYIAAYTDLLPAPAETLVETPGLFVVETTRHGGDLPPTGTF